MSNTSKKLNLGCGTDIKEGWVNLDSVKLPGVDIVHNIEDIPLPFGGSEFDEILCQDVLEHVEYIPILKDLYRILKEGGKLGIRVPHFTSVNNFIDPQHKKRFSVRTFEFFVKNSERRKYYTDFLFDRISSRKITFEPKMINFLGPIVNINYRTMVFYEDSCISNIFSAQNIIVELIK